MSMRALVLVLPGLLGAACGGSTATPASPASADAVVAKDSLGQDTAADVAIAGDAGADSAAIPADAGPDYGPKPDLPPASGCNTALGWIPKGLQTIQWDDGKPGKSLPEQGLNVVGKKMADQQLWEAVRFDLEKPVRVWGFSIRWAGNPAPDAADLTAGLFPDLSNNGFDFWQFQSYFTGGRCPGDLKGDPAPSGNGDGWLDYALPEPMTFEQPQLVYVAHKREGVNSAAFALDSTIAKECTDAQKCCETFARCHSAWNLPTVKNFTLNNQSYFNWNGLSSSHATDFLVRLWVEPLPEPAPAELVFAPMPTPADDKGEPKKPSNRHSFGDFDNDGDDDLLMPGPQLWRNDDGKLVEATADSGLQGAASGGVWGDYDNDGCPDIFTFVEGYSDPDRLWKGDCKGKFADVTANSGIDGNQTYNDCKGKGKHAPSAGAAWGDFDADGLLDLYVSRFQCWDDYSPYQDTVFHNLGGGKFEDWTGTHGFPGPQGYKTPSRGALTVDADRDGDVDVFVNNYVLVRNLYFRNDGGTFTEDGAGTTLAGKKTNWGGQTYFGHSIGAAFGDLNGDGLLDAVVANLAHPRFYNFSNKTQVLIQDKPGHWNDIQGTFEIPMGDAGIRYQETHSVPALGDFDQDGDLDLAISAVYEGRPTDFYWGNGDGTFSIDRLHAGITSRGGWGLASADLDNDGDLELIAQNELLRNQLPASKKGGFLQVRTVGDGKSNRMGLGASVEITVGGKKQVRYVNGGGGQGGQDSPTCHFGLGTAESVDSIEVRWIGADVKTYKGPFAANQRLWVYHSGKVQKGWKPSSN